jgi:hypothetical protein
VCVYIYVKYNFEICATKAKGEWCRNDAIWWTINLHVCVPSRQLYFILEIWHQASMHAEYARWFYRAETNASGHWADLVTYWTLAAVELLSPGHGKLNGTSHQQAISLISCWNFVSFRNREHPCMWGLEKRDQFSMSYPQCEMEKEKHGRSAWTASSKDLSSWE